MHGALPPLPLYAFMAYCAVRKKHGDEFTFNTVYNTSVLRHEEKHRIYYILLF
jgi:hypothetical protein